jgi:hypothetical protein
MKVYFGGLTLLGVIFSAPRGADGDKLKQHVQKLAERVAGAVVNGEYDKIVDLTHPKVVEKNGGRQKMVATMKAGMEAMKAKGVSFRLVRVEAPTVFVKGGSDLFTVVPTVLELKGPKATITQKGFLIGVSGNRGKKWTFIDGTHISRDMLKTFIAHFPAKLDLPKKEKPVITKDKEA